MPQVHIDYTSPLPAQETFHKVKSFLSGDETLKKISGEIQADFDEANLSGTFKGGQFKAQMKVKEASHQSQVSIQVDLPMLLGAFKGKVKSTIEGKLSKILG